MKLRSSIAAGGTLIEGDSPQAGSPIARSYWFADGLCRIEPTAW
jgi:hypothetical protein